jgi:hypothetical protein
VRKSITSFLLLIILVQVMGYYLAFRIRQNEVKEEMHAYLKSHTNDQHLTHFHLPLHNGELNDERFTWDNDNEFEFAGKMYDVIERNVSGDAVVLHCLEDAKETELLKVFEQMQKSESQKGKSRTASLVQLISTLYLPMQASPIAPAPAEATNDFNSYTSSTVERAADILTPPPQDC